MWASPESWTSKGDVCHAPQTYKGPCARTDTRKNMLPRLCLSVWTGRCKQVSSQTARKQNGKQHAMHLGLPPSSVILTMYNFFFERPCAGACDHDFEVCPIGTAWFCFCIALSLLMICVRALFAQVGLLLDEQDSAKRLVTSRPRKPLDAKEGGRRDFAVTFCQRGLYVVTLEV